MILCAAEFSLYFPTLADEGARSENLAAFHRLAIGDKIDVYGNKRAEVIEKKRQRKGNEEVLVSDCTVALLNSSQLI